MKTAPRLGSLDLALVLDTTGSMETHVAQVGRRAADLAAELRRQAPDLRLGVVAFKDHGPEGERDTYLTRVLPLTDRPERWVEFLRAPALAAGRGGGGAAEAVECALRAARSLAWRPASRARRALVLVGDRPPRDAGRCGCPHGVDYRDEVEALARAGVAIHAVHVGGDLAARRVFEYLAARTGGAFSDLRHVRELPATIAACAREAAELEALAQAS